MTTANDQAPAAPTQPRQAGFYWAWCGGEWTVVRYESDGWTYAIGQEEAIGSPSHPWPAGLFGPVVTRYEDSSATSSTTTPRTVVSDPEDILDTFDRGDIDLEEAGRRVRIWASYVHAMCLTPEEHADRVAAALR